MSDKVIKALWKIAAVEKEVAVDKEVPKRQVPATDNWNQTSDMRATTEQTKKEEKEARDKDLKDKKRKQQEAARDLMDSIKGIIHDGTLSKSQIVPAVYDVGNFIVHPAFAAGVEKWRAHIGSPLPSTKKLFEDRFEEAQQGKTGSYDALFNHYLPRGEREIANKIMNGDITRIAEFNRHAQEHRYPIRFEINNGKAVLVQNPVGRIPVNIKKVFGLTASRGILPWKKQPAFDKKSGKFKTDAEGNLVQKTGINWRGFLGILAHLYPYAEDAIVKRVGNTEENELGAYSGVTSNL